MNLLTMSLSGKQTNMLRISSISPKDIFEMMRICIFPLHCCTLYFRKDCLHVHF
jgi:hypothetical protein